MGIHKGTKLTDNPKNKTIKVRLDDRTYEMLEEVSKENGISKSDVIRKGIELQKKKND